jgi:folate-binding protein YgfZ
MTTSPSYQAALSSVAFYPIPAAGYLQIDGPDRIDFLQRQSTNDLTQLSASAHMQTVLTLPNARILDVLTLIAEPETLSVITLPGRSANTAAYLKGKIFFMDKVTLQDHSEATSQIDLEGPEAGTVLQTLFGTNGPAVGETIKREHTDLAVQILGMQGILGQAYRFIIPQQSRRAFLALLNETGAAEFESETYETIRVEMGIPGPAGELTSDYTPLETNLLHTISSTKGCYTGQEVIARQITYDKVTRMLVGLQLMAEVKVGERVWGNGKNIGTITSYAQSPRCGPIALAIVKKPHDAPGTDLLVGSKDQGVEAKVVELPFE